jgi:hypothetical protein
MSFFAKVGNFVKSTGGAPASQAISGLGFQPKALILWTSGGTVEGTIRTQATGDARACVGFATGTAAADQFAASTTANTVGNAGRRVTQKAFLLSAAAGAVSSEASLTSFDSDGFTLSWTTNNTGESQIIHYLAIGGTDVQAKVLSFTSPVGTGNFATTGAGFQPNLISCIGSVANGLGVDTSAGSMGMHIGAAVSSSSRWASTMFSIQGVSSAGWRWHRNDRLVEKVNSTGASSLSMDLVSMDADGFTLNQTVAGSATVGVLCLNIPRVVIGTFTKPTGGGPAVGSVTGFGFEPAAVLLVSDQDINRANASSQTGARVGVSAFTKAGAESSVFSVPDAPNPITFACLEKSAKAAVKINNATPAIDAEATATLDPGGFTLTWNPNDAVATEFTYLAVGPFPDFRPRPSMGFVMRPRSKGRTIRSARNYDLRRTA